MDRGDIIFISLIGAIIVASTGHDGWGWLIFIAVLCL